MTFLLRVEKNPHNSSRHHVRHGPCQHRTKTEASQIVAAIGSQRPESTDLNTDGAEVGETAECKRRDSERTRIQESALLSEQGECNQLVEHHARPEQIADLHAVVTGNADQPRERSEDHAENGLELAGKVRPAVMGEEVVRAAEDTVDERDEGQE